MSTKELKTRLIDKIKSTDDHQILLEATRLMDIHLSDTEAPFVVTDEMTESNHTASVIECGIRLWRTMKELKHPCFGRAD